MNVLSGLNEAQTEAVLHTKGPLLMLAGAGSGKTKALTHRIAYLVAEKKVPPSSILAVTFTNKAANEMRDRILKILNRARMGSFFPFMGTFHSVCVRILRREATNVGLPTSFAIYDDSDRQAVLKQVILDLGLDEKVYSARSIGGLISAAKNELLSPADYAKVAYGNLQTIAAQVYPNYQAELKKAGALDFDDIIMRTVTVLRNNSDILASYAQRFEYILVDEYQDTNTAQYELIHLLASKQKNICVVGDDWQSIYSWRGANYRNILNFERDYPDAKVVKLEQNYRSTAHILDAAAAVIAKNVDRTEKKLFTAAGPGQKVFIEQLNNEMAEAQFIINRIEELIRTNKDISLNDFAVLYRVNAQSRPLEESLLRANLPYRIVGGVRFYGRAEIKDILCYLRFICLPSDKVSFGRIINVPTRGLGDKSVARVMQFANDKNINLLESCKRAAEIEGLSSKARNSLINFGELVSSVQAQLDKLNVCDTVELLLKRSGYLSWLDDGSILAGERLENIKEFISVAKQFNNLNLSDFLSEIALLSDIDNASFSNDAVTLMSLHAAKGLEFEGVFIVGAEEGLFPHSNSVFDAQALEEERRLCYVGMTRAKRWLYMLNASSRLIYGNTQHNMPSRFLSDIPSQHSATQLGIAPLNTTTEEFSAKPPPQLTVGDKVIHEVFGEGMVRRADGEDVEIVFNKVGAKWLNLSFAPVRKV